MKLTTGLQLVPFAQRRIQKTVSGFLPPSKKVAGFICSSGRPLKIVIMLFISSKVINI